MAPQATFGGVELASAKSEIFVIEVSGEWSLKSSAG
jgi:hypothetical protein